MKKFKIPKTLILEYIKILKEKKNITNDRKYSEEEITDIVLNLEEYLIKNNLVFKINKNV